VPAFDPAGFDLLGSYKFASSAASSTAISIEVREMLVIQFNVTGYGGTDIASFRFNGDSGTTYNTSFITWSTAAPTTTPRGRLDPRHHLDHSPNHHPAHHHPRHHLDRGRAGDTDAGDDLGNPQDPRRD
jgi:hypothetical protein